MPTIDPSFPKTGHGASGASVAASGVTTSGASVIVAVVCVDNPGGAISVSGGGLSWSKKVGQSLTGSGNGWVEIWAAQSAAALSSQTITASFTSCNGCDIAVYSVSGGNAAPYGATGSFQNNTSNTNPAQCVVNAQASGSLIIGGFGNFAGAVAPTALATTTLDYTASSIDSICAGHATTTGVGNITVGVSAPGANFSIAAALEILAPIQPKQWIRRQPMRNGPPKGDPVSRFRYAWPYTPTPASTAPVPTFVQGVSSTSNKSGNTSTGRIFNFQLPNDVGAGNCLVLRMAAKWSAGRTVAVTDGNGNTWPGSPAVTVNDGVGAILYTFVLKNAAAGATKVTVTFDAVFLPFQYDLTEWRNVDTVSPVDGTSTTSSTSAPNVTIPTFTPSSNNDANGGHLILSYFWNAAGYNGSSHPCSLYVPGQNSQLDAVETVWGATDNGTFQGAQSEVKPILGPVTPNMTITQTTNDVWLGMAVALKAASAGTPLPSGSGIIRIQRIHHRTNETPSNSTIKVQFPCSGNLIVMGTANWDSLMPITSITDNKGNTYTKRNTNSGCPQYWDGYNASTGLAVTGNDLVITITTGAGGSGVSMLFYDVVGAAAFPFDTTSFAGSTTDTGGANVTDQPAFTPTFAPGLTLACVAFGTGPSSGLNTGSPSGAVFDLVFYTGEVDADTMDNADGQAHVYHSTTAAQHWNWVVANGATTTSVQATAVSYKAFVSGTVYTVSIGLGLQAAQAPGQTLTLAQTIALAMGGAVSPSASLTLAQAVSLAMQATITEIGGLLVLPGPVSLGAAGALAPTMGLTLSQAIALDARPTVSPSMSSTMAAAVALSASAQLSPAAVLAMAQALTLVAVVAEGQSAGFVYNVSIAMGAGAGVVEGNQKALTETIVLNAVESLSPSSIATLLGAITLSESVALSAGGTLVMQTAAALAAAAALQAIPGGQNYAVTVGLAASGALTAAVQRVLGLAVSLDAVAALSPAAQQQLAATIALQVRQDLAIAGGAVMGVASSLGARAALAAVPSVTVTAALSLAAAAQLLTAAAYVSGGGPKLLRLVAQALQSAALLDLGFAPPTLDGESLSTPSISGETFLSDE